MPSRRLIALDTPPTFWCVYGRNRSVTIGMIVEQWPLSIRAAGELRYKLLVSVGRQGAFAAACQPQVAECR